VQAAGGSLSLKEDIMNFSSKLILSFVTISSLGFLGSAASAQTRWAHRHPRQREVLAREHHQIARINAERREGEITGAQARALRSSDRAIAAQDHADARANGGYITKAEQHQLNAEENAQSKTIGQ